MYQQKHDQPGDIVQLFGHYPMVKSKPVVLESVNTSYFEVFNIDLQKGEVFNKMQFRIGQTGLCDWRPYQNRIL